MAFGDRYAFTQKPSLGQMHTRLHGMKRNEEGICEEYIIDMIGSGDLTAAKRILLRKAAREKLLPLTSETADIIEGLARQIIQVSDDDFIASPRAPAGASSAAPHKDWLACPHCYALGFQLRADGMLVCLICKRPFAADKATPALAPGEKPSDRARG